ncbi:MAG: carboxypeptidase regulatory-like domain-containing protein [Flavobacteriaceae bacterium]|nr:carboxypeptidase regulatory-like domain-containing protein [Flavobacteriaceae bacterium]
MIWKIGTYLLLIAMPLSLFTSESDFKNARTSAVNFVAENVEEEEALPNDGAILGSVIAPNAEVVIKASNGDIIRTGTTDENGEFFINGFEAGNYTICIQANDQERIATHTFEDVEIRIGEVTALGTVTIE